MLAVLVNLVIFVSSIILSVVLELGLCYVHVSSWVLLGILRIIAVIPVLVGYWVVDYSPICPATYNIEDADGNIVTFKGFSWKVDKQSSAFHREVRAEKARRYEESEKAYWSKERTKKLNLDGYYLELTGDAEVDKLFKKHNKIREQLINKNINVETFIFCMPTAKHFLEYNDNYRQLLKNRENFKYLSIFF